MRFDYLIIGGSAAGTTAAEVIRGINQNASIAQISDEDHEQYSRVLLPHYIRGKVSRDQVFLKSQDWYSEKSIKLIKGIKVTKLDPLKHEVACANGDIYGYGKLLIAIGGYPIKLAVTGAGLANIFYMRTIEDADGIIKASKSAKKGVVIGGGFIGLEFTSCFAANGVEEITVLVLEDYFWQGKLDEASSKVLVNTLSKNGIKVLTNEEITEFRGSTPNKGCLINVITKSGKTFDADVVGVGIGIKSDLSWLAGSGIKINRAILTNEYLETNLPDVYAAGDCAEFYDVIFERQHIMGNWANATNQGLAVGKTISGQKTVFETASSYSINFFDGACSFIGVTDDKFADEIISRGSVASAKMTRIFVKKFPSRITSPQNTSEASAVSSAESVGSDSSKVNKDSEQFRIVGATVINNPPEVAPLTSAIKNRINISAHKNKLANVDFDLKNLS